TGSPMRRLNSRASRAGSDCPRRSAASPISRPPSGLTNTSDGISARRLPRRATSTRPSASTAAAVCVVPRSIPNPYRIATLPTLRRDLAFRGDGAPLRAVGLRLRQPVEPVLQQHPEPAVLVGQRVGGETVDQAHLHPPAGELGLLGLGGGLAAIGSAMRENLDQR